MERWLTAPASSAPMSQGLLATERRSPSMSSENVPERSLPAFLASEVTFKWKFSQPAVSERNWLAATLFGKEPMPVAVPSEDMLYEGVPTPRKLSNVVFIEIVLVTVTFAGRVSSAQIP